MDRTERFYAIERLLRDRRSVPLQMFLDALEVSRALRSLPGDQWRICFEWPATSSGPLNVEIVDYH